MKTYLDDVRECIRWQVGIPAPRTLDDLRELVAEYPDRAKPFLPDKAECRRLRLIVPDPLREEFRGRFIATLSVDAEFRAAVRAWIGGAA